LVSDERPLDLVSFHAYLIRRDRFQPHQMRPYPPLAPASLASYLQSRDWRALFVDPTLQPDETSIEVTLSRHRPRVVALFGHPSTRGTAWRMVARARRQGCLVLAIGDDPSGVPELYLDHGVHAVVRGEAELTVEAVLQHLKAREFRFDLSEWRGIAGLTFRLDGEVIETADRDEYLDLDRAPAPYRDDTLTRLYLQRWRSVHGFAQLAMVTSRGIPGAQGYRRRHPDRVAHEIADLRRRFEFESIRFVDHVFTDDLDWHRRFATCCEERGCARDYVCLGRVRDIHPGLLRAMQDAGCGRITFDVGTGSRRLLRQLDRGYDIEDVYRAARLLREHGIRMGVMVSLGLDGETREDIWDTIEMIKVVEPEIWGVTLEDPDIAVAVQGLRASSIPGMRTLRHGWPDPERSAGRRLPVGFYRWALRLMAVEIHTHQLRRERRIDLSALSMTTLRPLYRTMVRSYPVRPR